MTVTSEQPTGPTADARKRVLIDATPVTGSVDGLSVYIVNLIRNLPPAALAEFHFTILLNPGIEWPELAEAMRTGGMEELRVPIPPIGPRRDWAMFRFLRRHRTSFDLIHITSHNYPLAMKGGVVTIHDVTFKRWFDNKSGIPGWKLAAQAYLDLVIRHALRRAQAVIAVSEATRQELIAAFEPAPSDAAKIEVIHEGWEHLLDYGRENCEGLRVEAKNYLFFLGSYRMHKNLTLLLEAFRLALGHIPSDRILVISGSSAKLSAVHRETIAAINAERERVVFTGYISNGCVARLYENADAFIFPSWSEGFGLPVLEAFHFGVPLLCSRATSLPEVAGEAALYFDPHDPRAIAEAIVRFYEDPGLGPRLAEAGRKRLGQFSWKKAANETVDLYRRCLSGPRAPR
jgi:glycosyltransferase involved in cell wall biosynthesis